VVQKSSNEVVEAQDTRVLKSPWNEGNSENQGKGSNHCKGDGAKVSFINVSGVPTKERRKEARKLNTAARKLEKHNRPFRPERKAAFLALTTGSSSSSAESSDSASITRPPLDGFATFSLAHISRFAASRSDPFMIYPFELTHREKRLLDHSLYLTPLSPAQMLTGI